MHRLAIALLLAPALVGCGAVGAARSPAAPVPQSYELELEPDLDLLTFRGRVRIAFVNETGAPLDRIPLHVHANARGVAPEGGRNVVLRTTLVDGKPARSEGEGSIAWLRPAAPVPPGRKAEIDVAFEGVLPRSRPGESDLLAQGLSQIGELLAGGGATDAGDYGVLAFADGVLSFGNWYPQLPPYLHGAWQLADETALGDASFAEAADYRTTVTVPADVVVACTGHVVSTTPLEDGRIRRVYEAPRARSVAVEASRRFVELSRRVGEATVHGYHLPGHEASGSLVVTEAAAALAYYQEAFGPYPWRDLDVVEAPLKGGAGGVEFTGLVTCSSALYGDAGGQLGPLLRVLEGLAGDAAGPIGEIGSGMEEMLPFVVAHEVAHQWWNAAVGSDSRREPFLDEALANFSAIRYLAHARGPDAAARHRDLQLVMAYRTHRALGGADLPVASPVSAFGSSMAYSAIVYGKGALFFEDLVSRYGEAPVMAALARYYRKGRHRITTSGDLRAELLGIEGASRGDVARLWTRWLLETHGDEDIPEGSLGPLMRESGIEEILDSGSGVDGLPALLQELLGGIEE